MPIAILAKRRTTDYSRLFSQTETLPENTLLRSSMSYSITFHINIRMETHRFGTFSLSLLPCLCTGDGLVSTLCGYQGACQGGDKPAPLPYHGSRLAAQASRLG